MESFLDNLGGALWILMFATPLITIPLLWKLGPGSKLLRVLLGLLLAVLLSIMLYFISLEIIFRDGMGPG